MPHIDPSGAEAPDFTPADTAETMDTAAAQRVEQEKLTRRAALRKLGFGAGLAAFSLLGVDDFARMVGQRLQRNAHDNKTALAVAKEFQSAGIALANGPSGVTCQHCIDQDFDDHCYCEYQYGPSGDNPNDTTYQHCTNQARNNFNGCLDKNCAAGENPPQSTTVCSHFLKPPQGCGC